MYSILPLSEPMIKQVKSKPFPLQWANALRCLSQCRSTEYKVLEDWFLVKVLFLHRPVLDGPVKFQAISTSSIQFKSPSQHVTLISQWHWSVLTSCCSSQSSCGLKETPGEWYRCFKDTRRSRSTLHSKTQAIFLSWKNTLACTGTCPGHLYHILWLGIWDCITVQGTKGGVLIFHKVPLVMKTGELTTMSVGCEPFNKGNTDPSTSSNLPQGVNKPQRFGPTYTFQGQSILWVLRFSGVGAEDYFHCQLGALSAYQCPQFGS